MFDLVFYTHSMNVAEDKKLRTYQSIKRLAFHIKFVKKNNGSPFMLATFQLHLSNSLAQVI